MNAIKLQYLNHYLPLSVGIMHLKRRNSLIASNKEAKVVDEIILEMKTTILNFGNPSRDIL